MLARLVLLAFVDLLLAVDARVALVAVAPVGVDQVDAAAVQAGLGRALVNVDLTIVT